mmetsp:Transcript_5264/g.10521  ORF Transcript_5264/g.10521 Transcript_5264/m.10521 type:complete len:244 (+) Transcript_5264:104-835(+)
MSNTLSLTSLADARLTSRETVFLQPSIGLIATKYANVVKYEAHLETHNAATNVGNGEKGKKGKTNKGKKEPPNTLPNTINTAQNTKEADTEGERGREELRNALNSYAVEIGKIGMVEEGIEAELKLLNSLSASYASSSESVSKEIASLRTLLSASTKIRNNKLEYESLAEVINVEGGKMGEKDLEEEIKGVKREVEEIEGSRDRIESEVQDKEKAFQNLLCAIRDLQRLQEEGGEEDGMDVDL